MYENKSYINKKTIEEIEEKGFSVYNYISFKELISTVNKDYLTTLNLINIPFALATGVVGYFSFEMNNFSYLILLFIVVYFFIFVYLISKLIYRTYNFSLVTNVIYTRKGLIINDEIHHYDNDLRLKKLLEKLESLFDEYLSKPSSLMIIIKNEEKKLLSKLNSNFETVARMSYNKSAGKGNQLGKLLLVVYALLFLYSISVILFYGIGLILGLVFFLVLIGIISLYFSINKSDELKIKQEVTKIDKELLDLEDIYVQLNDKISTFSSGEIFDLSKHIEDEYNDFYQKINIIIDHKDKLKDIIQNSSYNDFIDFALFMVYLKDQFNKPLNEMIVLLEDYKSKVSKELLEAKETFETIDSKEKYQIETRIVNLETINKNISSHLKQLQSSIF